MPRYQLEALWEDSLLVLKKPSANLPLLETSMSLPVSAFPAETVSVSVALQDAGKWRVKTKGTSTMMGRDMVKQNG
uniref:Uncharacterized protein n=1 Tax=Oryza brachyantha TaxID=4533 RepID=J3LXT2_ORYBR